MKNSKPKIRSCFFIFVNLEKAFDRVSREGFKTAILIIDVELSSSFSVKVGVH